MSESESMEMIPPNTLLSAYTQGVFPMADDGEILWFSPEQRGIIPIDERFKINHGLKRALRKNLFEVHFNRDFEGVMRGCAEREETWIDETIIKSYVTLEKWDMRCRWSVGTKTVFKEGFMGCGISERSSVNLCLAERLMLVKLLSSILWKNFGMKDLHSLTPNGLRNI